MPAAYASLEKIFARIAHLKQITNITHWDEAVIMPPGGGETRAAALATLSSVVHEMLIDKRLGDLIEQAKQEKLTAPWQTKNLYWMEKQYRNATCLPNALVERTTTAALRAEQAWRRLRADNNWQDFQPFLEENVKLVRESAHIRAEIFQKNPYDVLLNDYSPDVSQSLIDPIFNHLKQFLPQAIPTIIEQQKSRRLQALPNSFAIDKQRALGLELMQAIGFDFNHGRLDVSHHPFCGGTARDVRITTRYNEKDLMGSAMAVCHETGHALYEQDLPQAWLDQPVGQALGMSVHESQSLLIEMQACRSLPFMQFLAQTVQKHFGAHPAFNAENLYHHYTRVQPGLIRVDADEVTYPLHVILRYEIEKQLIAGTLRVADLPEIWHEYMMKFLGLSAQNNFKDGVMQDVHWPSGAFGYFPAYTLGALIAAQLFQKALQQHPAIPDQLAAGNFSTLMNWLRAHIHSKASSLSFDTLLTEAAGEPLSAKFYLAHIQQRYM